MLKINPTICKINESLKFITSYSDDIITYYTINKGNLNKDLSNWKGVRDEIIRVANEEGGCILLGYVASELIRLEIPKGTSSNSMAHRINDSLEFHSNLKLIYRCPKDEKPIFEIVNHNFGTKLVAKVSNKYKFFDYLLKALDEFANIICHNENTICMLLESQF